MKVIDLFCGGGGFSEGFERAGFEIIKAYDIWTPAVVTHNQNHANGKEIAQRKDIYEISIMEDEEFEKYIPDTEIIIGSPPCIAFSNSNKSGKGDKTEGVKLIEAFLRIVARKQSKKNSKLKYWVMENVVNSSKYVKDSYNSVDLDWPDLKDYILHIPNKNVYNMKDFGVPTNRKRYLAGYYVPLNSINNQKIVTINDVQTHLGIPSPLNYIKDNKVIKDPIYEFEMNSKDITDHHYIKEIPKFEWEKAKRQKLDKGYMGKMSFPENINKPSRTIMATLSAQSRESMIFNLENEVNRYRFPTIREVATLMSFPIDFRFYGESDSTKYKLIGNAVAPKFAYEVALLLKNELGNHSKSDKFKSKKSFNNTVPFKNLNGIVFELKKEKAKKFQTKFSHHIPYLIIKAFRVNLENKFDEQGNVGWDAKIKYSQGKNAKEYKNISLDITNFTEKELISIREFLLNLKNNVNSAKDLQINYCKISDDRIDYGPEELLQTVRDFIINSNINEELINNYQVEKKIPKKIIAAYYILSIIVKEMGDNG
ncbi:DNA cytosine methyltransferase [Mammaliicoccus lentus]|uniref:DNA cytosine methyltransferase n=1 Tax=Mammaliicoccus lentus TaxID=42858 RepID=UPI001B334B40